MLSERRKFYYFILISIASILILVIMATLNYFALLDFFIFEKLFSLEFLTLMAIIVALFGVRFHTWLDRPKVSMDFDMNSDRCFRSARPVEDRMQDFQFLTPDRRQYFKLKVTNKGSGVAKKVRAVIDIYYENMTEAERFEPNNLSWITGKETIDIANNETTYVNLLSQVTSILEPEENYPRPPNVFVIRFEIANRTPRGLAWDRESRIYILKLVLHGDNLNAKTYWLKFTPNPDGILQVGQLEFLSRK